MIPLAWSIRGHANPVYMTPNPAYLASVRVSGIHCTDLLATVTSRWEGGLLPQVDEPAGGRTGGRKAFAVQRRHPQRVCSSQTQSTVRNKHTHTKSNQYDFPLLPNAHRNPERGAGTPASHPEYVHVRSQNLDRVTHPRQLQSPD